MYVLPETTEQQESQKVYNVFFHGSLLIDLYPIQGRNVWSGNKYTKNLWNKTVFLIVKKTVTDWCKVQVSI